MSKGVLFKYKDKDGTQRKCAACNEDKKIKRPDIIERYIPPLTRRERRKLERDKKRGKGIH